MVREGLKWFGYMFEVYVYCYISINVNYIVCLGIKALVNWQAHLWSEPLSYCDWNCDGELKRRFVHPLSAGQNLQFDTLDWTKELPSRFWELGSRQPPPLYPVKDLQYMSIMRSPHPTFKIGPTIPFSYLLFFTSMTIFANEENNDTKCSEQYLVTASEVLCESRCHEFVRREESVCEFVSQELQRIRKIIHRFVVNILN